MLHKRLKNFPFLQVYLCAWKNLFLAVFVKRKYFLHYFFNAWGVNRVTTYKLLQRISSWQSSEYLHEYLQDKVTSRYGCFLLWCKYQIIRLVKAMITKTVIAAVAKKILFRERIFFFYLLFSKNPHTVYLPSWNFLSTLVCMCVCVCVCVLDRLIIK